MYIYMCVMWINFIDGFYKNTNLSIWWRQFTESMDPAASAKSAHREDRLHVLMCNRFQLLWGWLKCVCICIYIYHTKLLNYIWKDGLVLITVVDSRWTGHLWWAMCPVLVLRDFPVRKCGCSSKKLESASFNFGWFLGKWCVNLYCRMILLCLEVFGTLPGKEWGGWTLHPSATRAA